MGGGGWVGKKGNMGKKGLRDWGTGGLGEVASGKFCKKERAKVPPLDSLADQSKRRRTTMAQVKRTAQGIDWKEALESDGDVLRALVHQVIEQVLEAEMDEALGAGKSERVEGRLGYRSGYRSRTLITRVGKLELRVPQDREGRFSTQLFERYQRSEKALVSALAEMYVQGVSTRKVKAGK